MPKSKDLRLASRYIPQDSTEIKNELGAVYTYERKGRLCAIAYRGTAGHADWNYGFSNAERRQKAIDEFFSNLKDRESRKAQYKAERKAKVQEFKTNGATAGDYSLTETAELVRRTLGQVFPNTKFSVRSKSYSGGCSIDVSWTDGPTHKQVKPILDRFEGADFDGMQDLKTHRDAYEWNGRRVRFHVDYVFGHRAESRELLFDAADRVAYETGLPMLEIYVNSLVGGEQRVPFKYFPADFPSVENADGVIAHDSHEGGGEWYSQLVYQVARSTSREQAAIAAELPQLVNEEYIDAVVRRMLEVA